MMRLILIILLVCGFPTAFSKNIPFDLDDHKQLARFAERTVMESEVRSVSCTTPHGQKSCVGYSSEEENKKVYLAITTLGEGKDDILTESLINLSFVRMGDDSYNLLGYYIFNRGPDLIKRLSKISSEKIVAHCHAVFNDLQKKEIRGYTRFTILGVTDLKVEDFCFNKEEADTTLREIIHEIKSGKLVLDEI